MPTSEFAKEYEQRPDKELLELWSQRSELLPNAASALLTALQTRGLRHEADLITAEHAESEEEQAKRPRYWAWLGWLVFILFLLLLAIVGPQKGHFGW
ncbi:hypothetical protein DYQ86_02895 [Acidobacteria bacterium AB60]|nr:hypothetical protein DYQ86_02895 [Acidobacteria bacterium AB60]